MFIRWSDKYHQFSDFLFTVLFEVNSTEGKPQNDNYKSEPKIPRIKLVVPKFIIYDVFFSNIITCFRSI